MTARGGKRAGAGRPLGARNKRTLDLEERSREAAAAIEQALDKPFMGDALAMLQAVYRDPERPIDLRVEAARAAIRFERPALASIEVQSEGTMRHVIQASPLSPEERDREWVEQHRAALQ